MMKALVGQRLSVQLRPETILDTTRIQTGISVGFGARNKMVILEQGETRLAIENLLVIDDDNFCIVQICRQQSHSSLPSNGE